MTERFTEKGSTVRVKLHDELAALELLGKHLGMFVDRRKQSTAGKIEITITRRLGLNQSWTGALRNIKAVL